MTYQTEHDADDAHARTGYKYKDNELTRLRARVERLDAALRYVRYFNSLAGIDANLAAWEEMHRVIAEALEDK